MTYLIAGPCLDVMDRSCVSVCPVDCIYEGSRMLYINPDECIDCGACEAECPTGAAYHHLSVPSEWADFEAINAEFVADHGLRGGAKHFAPVDGDHPAAVGQGGAR